MDSGSELPLTKGVHIASNVMMKKNTHKCVYYLTMEEIYTIIMDLTVLGSLVEDSEINNTDLTTW